MQTEEFLYWYKQREESKSFIRPKDAYERMWDCRNFEISHLWQRSVFLATFLIAIAGAYGTLLINMYFPSEQSTVIVKTIVQDETNGNAESEKVVKKIEFEQNPESYQQHLIAACLCWLGIVFSILWIMMAKGSKYWFEKYEKGICKYEEDNDVIKNLHGYPLHVSLPPLAPNKYNDNIFSTKAGKYSVSKVNASIGIIALVVFSILEILHFAKFLHIRFNPLTCLQYTLFSISIWFAIGAVIFGALRFLCKSRNKD